MPGESWDIDLVAGQHDVVGHVTVVKNGSNLEITYYTDGCNIVETHLMVVADPEDFILNNGCNPKVGQFPYGDSEVNATSAGPYEVPIPEGLTGNMVYIGAHAVVQCDCEEDPTTAVLCPDFQPDMMTPHFSTGDDIPGYIITANFVTLGGPFHGWCVDNTRYLSNDDSRNVDFICSYGDVPACTTFIERPQYLDRVNWLINNIESGWGRNTIQAAIWEILNPSGTLIDWQGGSWPHDATLRETIVESAMQNGDGFIPGCGDKVLILVYATGPDGTGGACDPNDRQVVGIEIPVECQTTCGEETAWAFNYPIDGTSQEFPGNNWFRYFGYLVAD